MNKISLQDRQNYLNFNVRIKDSQKLTSLDDCSQSLVQLFYNADETSGDLKRKGNLDDIRIGMPVLGHADIEQWFTVGVNSQRTSIDGVSCTQFGNNSLISYRTRHFDSPDTQTFETYRRLLRVINRLEQPHLLRIWNYMPGINDMHDDEEVYRKFCIGRNLAFEDAGLSSQDFSAASALGYQGKGLLVYMIVSNQKAKHFENQKQLSAYLYPRQYGPKSPSFARATLADSLKALFVSGTASIKGHQTFYPDDVDKQLQLTLDNIDCLVKDISKQVLAGFNPIFFKVYIRNSSDFELIQKGMQRLAFGTPCIFLEADICRRDLLLEIEAIYTIEK